MGHHHALGILGALDIGEIHQKITKDLKPTLSNYHFQPKILRRAMVLKGNMEADKTGWGNNGKHLSGNLYTGASNGFRSVL